MKVIISHDVDHLSCREHRFMDRHLGKFLLRSCRQFLAGRMPLRVLLDRTRYIFGERLNRIPEILEFDADRGIPSTFFFAMNQGIGLKYRPEDTVPWIDMVKGRGFDAGVHTIEIHDRKVIQEEHDRFSALSGPASFGTRIHYVRYDDETFLKLAGAGYSFDTSEFDRTMQSLGHPYLVSGMWEFPLHIMEGYMLREGPDKAVERTVALMDRAEEKSCRYLTFLFHDLYFDRKVYPAEYEYYLWFVGECVRRGYTFISYRDVINELEADE